MGSRRAHRLSLNHVLDIIPNGSDTEIDWIAYMEEVEGWAVDGHTNYTLLKGNTGPLVYPAGFLYVYRALRWITGGGRGAASVRIAQWCFVAVYLAVQALALAILRKSRCVPENCAFLQLRVGPHLLNAEYYYCNLFFLRL